MDIYLIALIVFIVLTIIYFVVLKPDILKQIPESGIIDVEAYKTSAYPKLAIFVVAVCISQFILNTAYLNTKCSGATKDNIGTAALYTFLPWLFFLGITITMEIIYPEFKSPFSNVFGFFAVSGGATKFFTDYGKKKDFITEMCNDISVLINPITIENFEDTWVVLNDENNKVNFDFTKKIEDEDENITAKQRLLKLVQMKDNVGIASWYIYTAILITSFVYFKLAETGCSLSPEQIKENHDKYVKEQEANDKKQASANSAKASLN
uniref:Uncharacterized protein n=1 Tax=viral metagenome TaxID=1070528 RepID=A0A6C0I7S0_9ZZZZ